MSGLATDRRSRLARRSTSRRGSALFGAIVVIVGMLGLLCATSVMSAVEVKDARRAVEDVRAQQIAEAGVERGMNFLSQAVKATSVHDPLIGVTSLFSGGSTITPFVAEGMVDGDTRVGAYTVRLTRVDSTPTSVTIAIESTGYVPDAPANMPANRRVDDWQALRATVRLRLGPSEVFDHGYFLNNWGWFYGSSIYCNGNVRTNAQFDAAGYAPTVTGQPLYDAVAWNGSNASLSGYRDDNGDGLADGNDGGVFSGWDIVGVQNLQGNGGHAENQHDFEEQIPMPNLSDLSNYESSAAAQHGSISIGGVQVSNAVYGDEVGEKQNLYLVGTDANPIVIHGPVVVRGDVLISGVVKGQGAIYSGGNVYVPNSVTYKDAPTTRRPAGNDQAATEAWLSANGDKDFLGLFARENVVVGDYTNWMWQYYVGWWMSESMNSSVEDAGLDGVPHTRRGRDGILGTPDDDVLEGDGVFTIDHYTEADAALGVIPPGASIGDPIPGSGEDIDGDGQYDDQTSLADVALSTALNETYWGGDMPAGGVASYSSISSMNATQLDAVFYTNHSFCWTVLGDQNATINGALVSRNEDVIYGTPALEINYDCRLLGGSSGKAAGLLPSTIQPIELLHWTKLDVDPNHAEAAP